LGARAWGLLAFVRMYQIFLSPFLGGACKFYPSCSNYAVEAIQRHGAGRGFVLAMKRLGRCQPFTQGGYDPVPDEDKKNASPRGEEPVN
jgi:putative membrane protein insertion efficiency factor